VVPPPISMNSAWAARSSITRRIRSQRFAELGARCGWRSRARWCLRKGSGSHDTSKRDDPAADDFPSFLQFVLSGCAAACRMLAPVTTLFQRFNVRENPEPLPLRPSNL
jgi:hypothetical protein